MCVFRPAYIHTYIWMNSLTAMKLHHHKVRHTFAHGWAAQFPKHVVRGRMGNYQRCSFQLSPNSVFLRYNLERKVSFALLPCRGRQTTTWLIFKIYVLFAPNWKVKTLSVKCGGVCLNFVCEWATQTCPALFIHKKTHCSSTILKRGYLLKHIGATFETRLFSWQNELCKHKLLHTNGYKASRRYLREEWMRCRITK